jgi:SulP family sulfate permease
MKGDVLDMLGRGGYVDRIGEENIFLSKLHAVKKIVLTRLDPVRCRSCKVRIFNECSQIPDMG